MNTELNKDDITYLTIGKIVDVLKNNVANIEELWINTNPLDIRFEITDEDGTESRYSVDLEKNNSLYFVVNGLNGKISTNELGEILKSDIPELIETTKNNENIKFRLTTMEHLIDFARIKEFANKLELNLDTETTPKRKMKM